MAIKRYSHIPYDGPTEDEYGDYVLVGDHLDSHRFDEAAEKLKFEAWARLRSMDLEHRNIPGVGKFFVCHKTLLGWEVWKGCALAREKEFTG